MESTLPEIYLGKFKTNDSEEVNELISNWDQEHIQLKKGQSFWELDMVQVGDFQIFVEHYGVPTLARGLIPHQSFAIALPQFSAGDTVFMGQEVTSQTALMSRWPYEFDIRISNHYKHTVIVAPVDPVLTCAEKMQRPLEESQLSFTGLVLPDLTACQQLHQYLQDLFFWAKHRSRQRPDSLAETAFVDLIMADVLPLFIDVLTAKPAPGLAKKTANYRCLAQQAEAFMLTHLDQPVTLQALCQQVAVSPRTLNYCFQEMFGLSPMETLKVLRLHQIRRVLRDADPTTTQISQVAPRFGFWHMAQLSADYKRMFGELPSATLNQGYVTPA
jgi:AraC family ethanolamine operon transcriptional activator